MPSSYLVGLLLCWAVPSAASFYALKHTHKTCTHIWDWKLNEFDENNAATNTVAGCAAACQAHGPACVEIIFGYLTANPTNRRGDCYLMKAGCVYHPNTRFKIYTVTHGPTPSPTSAPTPPQPTPSPTSAPTPPPPPPQWGSPVTISDCGDSSHAVCGPGTMTRTKTGLGNGGWNHRVWDNQPCCHNCPCTGARWKVPQTLQAGVYCG